MPTLVGVNTPTGHTTNGKPKVEYSVGCHVPQEDNFYWELHLSKPIQAARFVWTAIRNGKLKAIELYDLIRRSSSTFVDLADSRKELVRPTVLIIEGTSAAARLDVAYPVARGPSGIAKKKPDVKTWQRRRDARKGWLRLSSLCMRLSSQNRLVLHCCSRFIFETLTTKARNTRQPAFGDRLSRRIYPHSLPTKPTENHRTHPETSYRVGKLAV